MHQKVIVQYLSLHESPVKTDEILINQQSVINPTWYIY